MGIADAESYTKQLIEMQKLLVKKADDEEVVETLGTSISALYSVPTAIYCFLRAQEGIPGIKVHRESNFFFNAHIFFSD